MSAIKAPRLPILTRSGVGLIHLLGVQWLAPLAVVGGIVLLAGAGIVYKEDIKALLHAFIRVVDRCGQLCLLSLVMSNMFLTLPPGFALVGQASRRDAPSANLSNVQSHPCKPSFK